MQAALDEFHQACERIEQYDAQLKLPDTDQKEIRNLIFKEIATLNQMHTRYYGQLSQEDFWELMRQRNQFMQKYLQQTLPPVKS